MTGREMLTGSGYGLTVAVQGSAEAMTAAHRGRPFWWQDSSDEPERVWEIPSPGAASFVMREIEHWVAEHAVNHVFVHAACVAIDRRVLLLPGRSYAGKTTMCVELLRQGATYFSDEYAVIDMDGSVHPYPRPLQVRTEHLRRATSASSLGASTASGPLRVGAVAVLAYERESEWDVQSLTPARAVLAVLDNVLCARTRPAVALEAVRNMMDGVLCVMGRRGESEHAGQALINLLR